MMCRIDAAFGSGKRNIIEVLVYEIYELNNIDVLETFVDERKLSNGLCQKMKRVIAQRSTTGHITDSKDEIKTLVGQLILSLSNLYGKNLSHCLWLCEEKYVRDLYGKGTKDTIVYYEVSDVILSDLGMSGKLYAYSYNPKPIT